MEGAATLNCANDGVWDATAPRCVQVDCGPPPSAAFVVSHGDYTMYGSKVNGCVCLIGVYLCFVCSGNNDSVRMSSTRVRSLKNGSQKEKRPPNIYRNRSNINPNTAGELRVRARLPRRGPRVDHLSAVRQLEQRAARMPAGRVPASRCPCARARAGPGSVLFGDFS